MKETTVLFDQVRDCPHWLGGTCIHFEGTGECNIDEISLPPQHCPCAEAKI